jgi:hypothetical protein
LSTDLCYPAPAPSFFLFVLLNCEDIATEWIVIAGTKGVVIVFFCSQDCAPRKNDSRFRRRCKTEAALLSPAWKWRTKTHKDTDNFL